MGVRFACHACGKPLNIKQDLAGKRGKCPKCKIRFRIPESDAETSTPVDDPVPARAAVQKTASTPTPTPTSSIDVVTADPNAAWYVRPPSGGQYGPADGHLLQQWIAEGRVAATALIWRDGWAQWRPADEVLAEIADDLPGRPEPTNPASIGPQNASPSPTPTATTPAVVGQTGIGATRQGRSMQRIFWITTLSIVAVILVGVLAYLVTRP